MLSGVPSKLAIAAKTVLELQALHAHDNPVRTMASCLPTQGALITKLPKRVVVS